jgi:hypothetical protein
MKVYGTIQQYDDRTGWFYSVRITYNDNRTSLHASPRVYDCASDAAHGLAIYLYNMEDKGEIDG